jgi:TorA maturation chaperone TorD
MARLVNGEFDAAPAAQRELFERHIAPWMGRFFTDLEHAKHAGFYRCVGGLGRVFLEIEVDALALPA